MSDALILALLEAVPNLNVWDGYVDADETAKVISVPLPYVVFYSGTGDPINARLGGAARGRTQRFRVHHVGLSREQAKWAGAKAEGALHGSRLVIAGKSRLITKVPNEGTPFVLRDDTWTRPGGAPLFFGADVYTYSR